MVEHFLRHQYKYIQDSNDSYVCFKCILFLSLRHLGIFNKILGKNCSFKILLMLPFNEIYKVLGHSFSPQKGLFFTGIKSKNLRK